MPHVNLKGLLSRFVENISSDPLLWNSVELKYEGKDDWWLRYCGWNSKIPNLQIEYIINSTFVWHMDISLFLRKLCFLVRRFAICLKALLYVRSLENALEEDFLLPNFHFPATTTRLNAFFCEVMKKVGELEVRGRRNCSFSFLRSCWLIENRLLWQWSFRMCQVVLQTIWPMTRPSAG